MIKKIYYLSILTTLSLSAFLFYLKKEIYLIIFIGAFIPILTSYLNIKLIDIISSKYDHQITAKFNAAQFFIKSIFVISLMFIGIKELELNIPIFIGCLCSVWFIFHIMEGFYTNSLIKKNN